MNHRIFSIDECAEVLGWPTRKTMEALQQVDFEVFPGLSAEHYGDIEEWEIKWAQLPDAGRILVDGNGETIGYWSFAPLTSAQSKAFEQGRFFDTDMQAASLPKLEPGVPCDVYVSAIVIREKYRNGATLLQLYRSFFLQLAALARRGIFIERIYANAFSPEGEALCRGAGAQKLSPHSDQGVIYGLSMFPFPAQKPFTRFPLLEDLYRSEEQRRRKT